MKKRYQVLLLLVFGLLFAAFASNPPSSSGEWASWVQAWGSIAAICAAVWVAAYQHEKTELRAIRESEKEVENFLAGVREELRISHTVYMVQVGQELEKSQPGQPIWFSWAAPGDPFKVYGATVGVIGRVRDDAIRQQVISTYVIVGGLLHTWATHDLLLEDYTAAAEVHRRSISDPLLSSLEAQSLENRRRTLVAYGDQLRSHHHEASARIIETVDAIDRYLEKTRPG